MTRATIDGWMAQLGFVVRQHDELTWLLLDDFGNEREATMTERVLWDALMAANAQFSEQPACDGGLADYAPLPKPDIKRGGFPDLFSEDQLLTFADDTHAMRTKSMASREFLARALAAMEGAIDVADRKTVEFDALRSCVVDLTLMLFKPEALPPASGHAPG